MCKYHMVLIIGNDSSPHPFEKIHTRESKLRRDIWLAQGQFTEKNVRTRNGSMATHVDMI